MSWWNCSRCSGSGRPRSAVSCAFSHDCIPKVFGDHRQGHVVRPDRWALLLFHAVLSNRSCFGSLRGLIPWLDIGLGNVGKDRPEQIRPPLRRFPARAAQRAGKPGENTRSEEFLSPVIWMARPSGAVTKSSNPRRSSSSGSAARSLPYSARTVAGSGAVSSIHSASRGADGSSANDLASRSVTSRESERALSRAACRSRSYIASSKQMFLDRRCSASGLRGRPICVERSPPGCRGRDHPWFRPYFANQDNI